MKLKELIAEMPQFVRKNLALSPITPEDTQFWLPEFDRDFEILSKRNAGAQTIVVGLAKDKSKCILGLIEGDTVYTECILEFQPAPDYHEIEGPVLQVSVVQAKDNAQGTGFGYEMYKAILNAGYSIISDYTQYNGGQKLWEKIVNRSGQDGHYVLVMKYGEIMTEKNGAPIKYNGANIPFDTIWGDTTDHSNTLLVATNNKVPSKQPR